MSGTEFNRMQQDQIEKIEKRFQELEERLSKVEEVLASGENKAGKFTIEERLEIAMRKAEERRKAREEGHQNDGNWI
jgi:hypothetical protein